MEDLQTPDAPTRKRVVETKPKTNGYGSEPARAKLPASKILDTLRADISAQLDELGSQFLEGIENAECKQPATLAFSVKYTPPKDDDVIGEFVVQAKLATKSLDRKRRVDISGGQLDLF